MSVKVGDLQTTIVNTSSLEAQVREHLHMIDDKLRGADRTFGRNILRVKLPATFGIPGLDPMEQQRFVYSEILDSLQKRGFEARIWLGKDSAELFIAYIVTFNPEQIEAMSAIIRNSVISAEDIPKFMNPLRPSPADDAGRKKKSSDSRQIDDEES